MQYPNDYYIEYKFFEPIRFCNGICQVLIYIYFLYCKNMNTATESTRLL